MRRLPVLLLAGLLLAGCGSDSGSESGSGSGSGADADPQATVTVTETATPTPSPTPTPTPTPTPDAPTPSSAPYDLSWDPLVRDTAPLDVSDLDTSGFTSPSGNIACLFTSDPYAVRCDRRDATEQIPPPGDCPADYGNVVQLRPSFTGELLCAGDTVFGIAGETDGSRVLPYGDSVMFGRLVCTSGRQGVQCLDDGGGGFLISRGQILF